MSDVEYKPNSHKYRENQQTSSDKKEITKVVSGGVRTKKKSNVHKLTDVFISEDASNVKSYILMDVLVPAIKKAVSDIVKDGIDMMLYGETHGKKRSSGDYVSYRNYSDRRDDRGDTRMRTGFDFDDLVFDTRADAEATLDQMNDVIDRYNVVTVADMYDSVDLSAPYTANKYGWTNIRNADVVRVRDGWIIKLPRAKPID